MSHDSYLKLLLVFMLHQVCCQEPEPVFRTNGGKFALGNCFGRQSIVVYRCSPEGDQLLGNSSDDGVSPPAHLRGRVHVSKSTGLVGLQIHHLTNLDSGIYRIECWQDGKKLLNNTMHLFVCAQESASLEIVERERDGGAELRCDAELDGHHVKWYREVSLTFNIELILDSSVSLLPLVDKLKGAVKVRDNGAVLSLDRSVLENSSQFYCLVMKVDKCLAYQNMYKLFDGVSEEFFVSIGDKVVLPCQLEGTKQHWRTPLGLRNSTSGRTDHMFVSSGSGDFSLVISAITDKHDGEYSCITDSQDIQYSIVLCPSKPPKVHFVTEGQVIKLECDVGQNGSQHVQWYQENPRGESELIMDSNNEAVAIPEHLQGRVTASSTGLSLEFAKVRLEDEGTYSCVVLGGSDYLAEDYEYKMEDEEDVEDSYGEDWQETSSCILKQKNIVTFEKERDERRPITTSETNTLGVEDGSGSPDIATVAVGASVGLLVVAAVIIAVILIKKKRQRKNEDIRRDPGCEQSLTDNL